MPAISVQSESTVYPMWTLWSILLAAVFCFSTWLFWSIILLSKEESKKSTSKPKARRASFGGVASLFGVAQTASLSVKEDDDDRRKQLHAPKKATKCRGCKDFWSTNEYCSVCSKMQWLSPYIEDKFDLDFGLQHVDDLILEMCGGDFDFGWPDGHWMPDMLAKQRKLDEMAIADDSRHLTKLKCLVNNEKTDYTKVLGYLLGKGIYLKAEQVQAVIGVQEVSIRISDIIFALLSRVTNLHEVLGAKRGHLWTYFQPYVREKDNRHGSFLCYLWRFGDAWGVGQTMFQDITAGIELAEARGHLNEEQELLRRFYTDYLDRMEWHQRKDGFKNQPHYHARLTSLHNSLMDYGFYD